ncbi:antitoxin [Pseudonocardia spinosispora]|uniref:antitoxin n=1 Tax=Pseudonocardia spinosispora TaxID=103441 RepID=UPI000417F8DB|nr:antitoxin [Pseudonocardia spinosispora]
MSLIKKLAVLGAAAEAARRYAQKNPDKAREFADKAAQFADQRTKGKYSNQIDSAKRKLADVGGFSEQPPPVQATAVIDPVTPSGAPRPTPYKRG